MILLSVIQAFLRMDLLRIKNRNQQEVRDCQYLTRRKKRTNKRVPNKSKEPKKAKRVLMPEYPEEREQPLQGHQYDNDILMRRSAVREGWQMFAHLCDLPKGRVEIFLALRKMKTG
jgi:hypothetical protein